MSSDASSIGGVTTRFAWNGAWIATVLLALIFALSLFAMNVDGRDTVVDRVPVADRLATDGGTRLPIEIGRSVCDQCR